MRRRNRILMLALVAVFLRVSDQPAAAPFAVVCEDVCAGGHACSAPCWLTQFEFDNEYPATTCEAASYTDCCGDQICNPATEYCNVCPNDCGYTPTCLGECGDNSHCEAGEVCNTSHECVETPPATGDIENPPPCGGDCDTNADCCGSEVCNGVPGGYRWCGIPSSTYCPSSPSCYSSQDCEQAASCQTGYEAKPMFCDPGISRCQFTQNTDCPSTSPNNMCRAITP